MDAHTPFSIPVVPGDPPPPAVPTVAEPESAPGKARRWVWPATAAVVIALGAAGFGATRLIGQDAPAPAASPTPAVLSVHGSLLLADSTGVLNLDGYHCQGMRGYDDIRQGAAVTITDASGTTIGLGSLSEGMMESSGLTRKCRFTWQVEVPKGKGFYGVEISHRGKVAVAEADTWTAMSVSLGN
jgi:hypothetical protein